MNTPDRPAFLSLLAALVWRCAVTIEIFGLGVHLLTHGARPTAGKLWIATVVAIIAGICHLALRRHYRIHSVYIRQLRVDAKDPHMWLAASVMIGSAAFAGWLFSRV
jgi:hypothetical protein